MPGFTTSKSSSTSSGASNGSLSSTGGSTSTPTFGPEMNDLIGQLMDFSKKQITNPTAGLAPIRNAGLDSINQSYAGVPQQVTQQLASRGYGSSGAMGSDLYKVALSKAGAQSGLEGQLASDALGQQQNGVSLAEQLLALTRGTSNTENQSTSQNNTFTQNQSGKATPSLLNSLQSITQWLVGA